MRSRSTPSATIAATRRASSSPISHWPSSATMWPRGFASLSPVFNLNLGEAVLKVADLDRPFDDSGVERRIILLQPFERARPLDAPFDARDQHFEVERLQDHVVGARLVSAHGAFGIGLAGDQHDGHFVPLDFTA